MSTQELHTLPLTPLITRNWRQSHHQCGHLPSVKMTSTPLSPLFCIIYRGGSHPLDQYRIQAIFSLLPTLFQHHPPCHLIFLSQSGMSPRPSSQSKLQSIFARMMRASTYARSMPRQARRPTENGRDAAESFVEW
jgi:hypothetical protein